MEKVRLGIIGLGNMGTSHAQKIFEGNVPQMELTALCDTSKIRKDYFKKTYPDIPFLIRRKNLFAADL